MGESLDGDVIRVRVQRFNPRVDPKPRFQTYQVPFYTGLSVMNVLDYIYKNLDGSLAYNAHSACGRGVCGRCVLWIDGEAGLACQTRVQGNLTLETPPGRRIVRDLVYSANSPVREEEDIFFID